MGHLTIARVKSVKDKKGFIEYLNKTKISEMEFSVKEFNLMQSILKSSGPDYKVLKSYPLL